MEGEAQIPNVSDHDLNTMGWEWVFFLIVFRDGVVERLFSGIGEQSFPRPLLLHCEVSFKLFQLINRKIDSPELVS